MPGGLYFWPCRDGCASGHASTSHYLVREHIVVDLRSGLEWLRCSVGQIYNQGMCEGEVLQFTYSEILEVIKQANKELGALAPCQTRMSWPC